MPCGSVGLSGMFSLILVFFRGRRGSVEALKRKRGEEDAPLRCYARAPLDFALLALSHYMTGFPFLQCLLKL